MAKRKIIMQQLLTIDALCVRKKNLINCYKRTGAKPIRTLLGLYGNHKKTMVISTVFFVLKSLPNLLIPIITANVINLVCDKPGNIIEMMALNAAAAVFLLVFNFFTNAVHLKTFNKAKRTVEAGLRGAMVRKLQQLSIRFHKETASARFNQKLCATLKRLRVCRRRYSPRLFRCFLTLFFHSPLYLLRADLYSLFFCL